MEILLIVLAIIILATLIYLTIKTSKNNASTDLRKESEVLYNRMRDLETNLFQSINASSTQLNNLILSQNININESNKNITENLINVNDSLNTRLVEMNKANQEKLDEMRKTVDEKLQESLDNRLSNSLQAVSERLEAMYKTIGEVQSITTSVADLKKVLSNTKQRGILGEIQLKSILEDIMPNQQYEENIATVPNSTERVEFAIKLPAQQGKFVYLPIDSKFPAETYVHLVDAYDNGDKTNIDICQKELINTLKSEAKDIRNKYIHIPDTTDFGIMFLPTEGLYSECCKLGMMEILQKEYHVTIAGPTTMAALLNSLQMGFRTLDIQKRSAEVWETLGAVKTEFNKFEGLLNNIQNRLRLTSSDLDDLVGKRTRAINRKLKDIESNTAITFDSNETYEDVVDLIEEK